MPKTQPLPKILIEIEGGLVTEITSTHAVVVHIVDRDNAEVGEPDGFDEPWTVPKGTWNGTRPE